MRSKRTQWITWAHDHSPSHAHSTSSATMAGESGELNDMSLCQKRFEGGWIGGNRNVKMKFKGDQSIDNSPFYRGSEDHHKAG